MSKPSTSKPKCPTSSSNQPGDRRKFVLDPVKVAPWRALPPGYIETNGPCKGLDKLQESGTIIIPTKYKIKDPQPIVPWKDVVEGQKEKYRQCKGKDRDITKEGRLLTPTKYRKRCVPETDSPITRCNCSEQTTLIAPWRFFPPGYTTKNCRVIFSEKNKQDEAKTKTKTTKRSPK